MSRNLFNPRGMPFSSQRPVASSQFGVNTQTVLNVPGVRLGPAAGIMPLMMMPQVGLPMGNLSQDLESSIDMHIRGAREEVRLLNEIMHQKLGESRARKESRDEVLSSGSSYTSPRVRPDEQSPANWSGYRTPNKLFAQQVSSQPSSSVQMFQSSGFGTSSGGSRRSGESQRASASGPAERGQSRYTSESASSILASFGLSNEDLELLSHYPDDQLTPDNLPFILRDIRVRKAKRSQTDVDHRHSSPGARDPLGSDSWASKVIDYGHLSNYGYSEKGGDSFKPKPLTTDPQKYVRDAPVSVSNFPSLDVKQRQPNSGPVSKKPPMEQRKNLSSMADETSKSGPPRDPLPVPSRASGGPPLPPHSSRPNLVNLHDPSAALKPAYAVTSPTWSSAFPSSSAVMYQRLPTPTMMNDYSAATPRIFPHTCSLCNIECFQIKDWIEHQNTSVHIESCRRLRNLYPDWNVETGALSRTERKPPVDRRSPRRRTRSASRSWSRSPSPRYHGSSSSRDYASYSRSPRRYRRSRSRSRSRSPRRASRPLHSTRRRSRTPPPRWSRTPPPRRTRSRSRSLSLRSSPRSSRRLRSSSSEQLAKKLIQSSGLSVTESTTLEDMMESLAPALLAELAKKKSTSSSTGKTQSSQSTRTGKARKATADSDEITLRLQGLHFSASYQEMMEALQRFGEVKRAILYKKIGEAAVVMEKEEDAKVLLETKELKIRGIRITVSVAEDTAKDIKAKLLAKKKDTPSAKPATKAKVAAKKTDGSTVKKVVKKDLPKKYVVQISDLPESGYTVEDLQNLAKPFGFSGLVIAVEKRMAYVQLPDLDSVTKMLKTYKENPAKLQDHQLSFKQMTRPVDFKSPESLFRVLMGIEKTAETANLGQRLLTVSNIPTGPKPAAEVKQLVKRFGSFKQDLVLYDKIILEMDTAAIAKTVYSRFQKFPCIVQNNPLTFSVVAPEAVKKKVDVKSTKPAPKAGPAAKKVVAAAKTAGACSKSAVPKTAAGKGKVSKAPPTQAKSTGMKAKKPAVVSTPDAAKKPAVASTPDAAKTKEPASAAPPAVSPTTAAAEEPSAKPTVPTTESAAVSAEIADGKKSQSDVSAADQGSAEVSEVPPLETKGEEVVSNTASQGNAAPAPAEGAEATAKVEEEDLIAKEADSKQNDSEKDQKSTGEPKADACPPAGKSPPADAPASAQAALDPDQKLLDFPPVTPEILRALEAAVQECRMRSSQRRSETKHAESAKSSPASGKELTPPKDKLRSRAQSEEDQPPVTTRGGSSGSSTGSRRSRHDHSPAPKKGKDPKGETDKHRGSSSSASKSSSSSKTAGDKKSEEDVQNIAEDTFPFDFNEFVTVDEVGDEAENKEAEGKDSLQHSTPLLETSSTRKRTRDGAKAASASPPAKKPSSDTQKSQKKQAPSVKAKNAKTAAPAAMEANDEGGREEVTEMESEASKMEVTVGETVEQEVKREETPAPPDAEVEDSAAKSALEVEEIKALETLPDAAVKTSTTAMETQAKGQLEGSGLSAKEGNEAVPAAQKPEEDPAEQSLTDTADSTKGPAAPCPPEATDPGTGAQERAKEAEAGIRKGSQGLAAALVTLDEVSEEEEDYPDEAEEEELLMQQNEGLVTVDEVGGDEDPFLQAVKDLQALVTLDEIVEENEEPSSEPFPFGMGDDTGDAFNPEALLTLDETQGDDEAEGEAKNASPPKSTGSPATHEGLVTLDETQGDDEDVPEEGPEKPVTSPSFPAAETDEEECRGLEELRKMNFVTVDEVGEEEEEQPPPPQEVDPDPAPAVKGGRPKRRGRQTPVRKSTRGQKAVPAKEEEEKKKKSAPESCSVVNPSDSGCPDPAEVPEPQTRNTEASTDVPDIKSLQSAQDTQSNGDKALPEDSHDGQHANDPAAAITEESKLRREGEDESTEGPDSKKRRTESPSPADFTMPAFAPNNPIGLEFVIPRTGFFCKLCSLFYGTEDAAKKTHCSSLKHYQNMEKYFRKLRSAPGRSSLPE